MRLLLDTHPMFSHANLMDMRVFAEVWPDAEFVQASLAQLPWCDREL